MGIVLQAAGLHGPRVSKLGTKPELAFFIFQAFLVDRCQRRKRKMATSAFNPYRPPEHGLVSFVLSNLLPAKKDESKDNDRTMMGHKEVDVDVDLEIAMRILAYAPQCRTAATYRQAPWHAVLLLWQQP